MVCAYTRAHHVRPHALRAQSVQQECNSHAAAKAVDEDSGCNGV
jgi:hypothetical protein